MTAANDQLGATNGEWEKRTYELWTARIGRRVAKGLKQAQSPILPMRVDGPWAIDGDGAETNGAGLVGATPLLTEQASTYAKVWDESATEFQDLATSSTGAGYTANYQLWPDTSALDDAVYFGGDVPFAELAFDVATAADYTAGAIVWEYWDGSAWSALTIVHDATGAPTDGTNSFEQDGAILWIPPTDWARTAVDSVTLYWVRCRVTTGLTTEPTLNSKEHQIVTAADAWTANAPAQIEAIRASSGASTLGSSNDTKFFVINQTTGEHTGELTWTLSTRTALFTDLNLEVAIGDELAVYVTQEDGTNEHSNVGLELHMANTQEP